MNYKVYKNIFNNDFIKYILDNVDDNNFSSGKVGNRINMNQKRRKDLFISDRKILTNIDNFFYNIMYDDVYKNFSDIKYREMWKLGFYNHLDKGFYNLHTDTAGDTKYRKTSCVTMLSNPEEYEGGELYFPDLNQKFKLDKGDVIIFKSSLIHGVHPVTKGERHVLVSFFFDDDCMIIKERLRKNKNISNYKPYLSNLKLEYPSNHYQMNKEVNTYNKGDIDYSDLHHKHKWNDQDDIYYEDNNSETLIITFSGMVGKVAYQHLFFITF